MLSNNLINPPKGSTAATLLFYYYFRLSLIIFVEHFTNPIEFGNRFEVFIGNYWPKAD